MKERANDKQQALTMIKAGTMDIFAATRAQDYNLVRFILNHDKKAIERRDFWGHTALDYAKKGKNRALVQLITEAMNQNSKPAFTKPEAPKRPALVPDDVFSLAKEEFNEDLPGLEDSTGSNQSSIISEDPIDTLKAVFPEIPVEVLRTVLVECGNNPEIATDFLLNQETPNNPINNQSAQSTTEWPTLPAPSKSTNPTQSENISKSQKKKNKKNHNKNNNNNNNINDNHNNNDNNLTQKQQQLQNEEYAKPSIELLKELSVLQLQEDKNQGEDTEGSVVLVDDYPYQEQWVDVEEEDGDEEENRNRGNDLESIKTESDQIDFDNDASFADSDKASSVVMIEPEEWDVLSAISDMSYQNENLEENVDKSVTETKETEVSIASIAAGESEGLEGSKLSFAAALRSNLNETEMAKAKKLHHKLPASTFMLEKQNKERVKEDEEPELPDSKDLARGHGKALKTRHNGEYRRKSKPKKTFKSF